MLMAKCHLMLSFVCSTLMIETLVSYNAKLKIIYLDLIHQSLTTSIVMNSPGEEITSGFMQLDILKD